MANDEYDNRKTDDAMLETLLGADRDESKDDWESDDNRPAWAPPPIQNEEELEERIRICAELELQKHSGQAAALLKLAEKYKYMHDQLVEKLAKRQLMHQIEVENYSRAMLQRNGKKTYMGAFGTVRLTARQYSHAITDRKVFVEWTLKNAPHLMTTEIKHVDAPDRKIVDSHIKRTGELPPGVTTQEKLGFSIKYDTSGITGYEE